MNDAYFKAMEKGRELSIITGEVPEIKVNTDIHFLYIRNKKALDDIANSCASYLVRAKPWENPQDSPEFCTQFARCLEDSETGRGLPSIDNLAALEVYFLLALDTEIYKHYAHGFKSGLHASAHS